MFSWKRDLFVGQRLIVQLTQRFTWSSLSGNVDTGDLRDLSHVKELTVHHRAELGRCKGKRVMEWPRKERERVGESCEITRCDLNIHSKYKYCMTSQLCSESVWSLLLSKATALDGHWGVFLLLGQVVQLTAMKCPGPTTHILDTSLCRWYGVQGMSDFHDNHNIWLQTPSEISENFLEKVCVWIGLMLGLGAG